MNQKNYSTLDATYRFLFRDELQKLAIANGCLYITELYEKLFTIHGDVFIVAKQVRRSHKHVDAVLNHIGCGRMKPPKGGVRYKKLNTDLIPVLRQDAIGHRVDTDYINAVKRKFGFVVCNETLRKMYKYETWPNLFPKAKKAPWTDYNGRPIFDGDRVKHPSGEQGVVHYNEKQNADESDKWFVDYGIGGNSRLCLQVGDKGMLRVF